MYKTMKRQKIAAALALLVLVLGMCVTLHAQPVGPDEARHSVFRVATKDAGGTVVSFGSAFGVGESAPITYLLTNYHVVSQNPDGVYVWVGKNTEIPCKVAVAVPDKDIAVLKLSTPIDEEPLPIGNDEIARVGDDVFALGYPTNDISNAITSFADDVSASKGIISKRTMWNDVLYYQIDAPLNQGNSGGPLLHESGCVVGIATMKMDDTEGINGAIRIEEALPALTSVGVSVKMATLTTDTDVPSATQSVMPAPTATPIPTPEATTIVLYTPQAEEETDVNTSGLWSTIWLVIFILAAAAFIAVLVYMIIKAKKEGKSVVSALLPHDEEPEEKDTGYIIGITGAYAGAVIALEGQTLFFGRDAQRCQLVFDEKDTTISRVHCSVRYNEAQGCFTLENYSGNGTYLVRGGRLEDGDAADLRSGDRFYLVDEGNLFAVSMSAPGQD